MKLVGGDPFWSVRNGLLNIYPPLEEDKICDVVVVGAGITGALVAFHLCQAGISTILIDKRDVGTGSTSGSTGLLQYEVDVPLRKLIRQVGAPKANRSYLLCLEALRKLQAIAKTHRIKCEMAPRPSLFLARSPQEISGLKEEACLRKKIGLKVNFWGPNEISSHYPFSRPAALFSENGAQVDPHRLTQGLLTVSEEKGLQIFDRTNAIRFVPSRRGIVVITDKGFKLSAKKIVIAAGFESQKYLSPNFGELKSTYALISEPVPDLQCWYRKSLIWETGNPYFYLRTTGENRIIAGGEDVDVVKSMARDKLIEAKTKVLKSKFKSLFPKIKLEVAYSWAGTFSSTKDGLAYIGTHRSLANVFFALGYGGNGITYSLIAAEIIRDQILGRKNPDASIFSFNR